MRSFASSGFTLLELVFVLVIVGVIAAVAVPKWSSNAHLGLGAEQLAQDIRYAQALSMSRGGGYTIVRTASDTYRVDGNTTVLEDVSITPLFNILFDKNGLPPATTTISLSDSGESVTVTVKATGAVVVP